MNQKNTVLCELGMGMGMATVAILCCAHINKTEESRIVRVVEKVGIWAGVFALGSLLSDCMNTNNIAAALMKSVTEAIQDSKAIV